jgi:hypothetical protein
MCKIFFIKYINYFINVKIESNMQNKMFKSKLQEFYIIKLKILLIFDIIFESSIRFFLKNYIIIEIFKTLFFFYYQKIETYFY